MISLQQLLKPPTEDQVLAFILNELTALGFRGTAWQEGAVQLNFLRAIARNGALVGTGVSNMARDLLVDRKGGWLDLIGSSIYRLPRLEGVKAVRTITLTNPPSGISQVINALDTVIAGSVRFSITGGAPYTLAPGAAHDFTATADMPGEGGNTAVAPKLAGHAGVAAAWTGAFSQIGTPQESDSRYATRLDLRFAELTYSVSLRAYELWALAAAPSVKRVRAINNYAAANDIRIALDPGTPTEIALATAYIANRAPPNDNPSYSAANVVAQAIKARPRVRLGTTVAQCEAALQAVIDAMPIGGVHIAGAPAGRLLRESLANALVQFHGGYGSSGLITPAADVVLGSTDVVNPTFDVALEYI